MKTDTALLTMEDVQISFMAGGKMLPVVNNLNLSINNGETIGIVGESGCGKSISALSILGLIPSPPGSISGGSIRFKDKELVGLSEKEFSKLRGNQISMIFQEPMTSLNPVFTIGHQIAEVLITHKGLTKKQALAQVVTLLEAVRIPEANKRVNAYPFEMSGGMRQRVMIAMALACSPDLLIADEPTTALDVSVQAQIFQLLKEMQEKFNTSIIFITHDMGVVAEMTDKVIVMYAGYVVEQGTTKNVLLNPQHPYTKGLIACIPQLDTTGFDKKEKLKVIPGMVPPVHERMQGCVFAKRCPEAMPICFKEQPITEEFDDGHLTACWYVQKEKISAE